MKIGLTMEAALQETADRLGTPEFQFFVITLAIQRETGGNLAETLSNLADVLRKRAQMKLKIRAMSSESKASAYIVGSVLGKYHPHSDTAVYDAMVRLAQERVGRIVRMHANHCIRSASRNSFSTLALFREIGMRPMLTPICATRPASSAPASTDAETTTARPAEE